MRQRVLLIFIADLCNCYIFYIKFKLYIIIYYDFLLFSPYIRRLTKPKNLI